VILTCINTYILNYTVNVALVGFVMNRLFDRYLDFKAHQIGHWKQYLISYRWMACMLICHFEYLLVSKFLFQRDCWDAPGTEKAIIEIPS
jgi:hypothetical protein